MNDAEIKEMVRARYGGIAEATGASCCVPANSCCADLAPGTPADKSRQMGYSEAELAAKPDGRLAISDVVNTAPLSSELKADPALLCSCIAGAAPVQQIETWLVQTGFIDVRVTPQPASRELVASWAPGSGIENFVVSATLEARKPGGDGGRHG